MSTADRLEALESKLAEILGKLEPVMPYLEGLATGDTVSVTIEGDQLKEITDRIDALDQTVSGHVETLDGIGQRLTTAEGTLGEHTATMAEDTRQLLDGDLVVGKLAPDALGEQLLKAFRQIEYIAKVNNIGLPG